MLAADARRVEVDRVGRVLDARLEVQVLEDAVEQGERARRPPPGR